MQKETWTGVVILLLAVCAAAGLSNCLSADAEQVEIMAGDMMVYDDSLRSPWQNWSWSTTANFSSGSPVHAGTYSLSVTWTAGWAGLFLHTTSTLDGAEYTALRFWIHGGSSGGQEMTVLFYDGNGDAVPGSEITASAGSWQLIELTMAELGSPSTISGIVFQDSTGGSQPTFYLDDIMLVGGTAPPTPTPTPLQSQIITVNAMENRHAISPMIYGMSFASETLAVDSRIPLNRWGGNSTTRYNWMTDTSNRAMDWFYENIPEDNPNPGSLPDGSTTDRIVEQNLRTGSESLITMPLIGWTPKDRSFDCGFRVSLYGAQQETDPWQPDCGNGVTPSGNPITGNNPADTSIAIGTPFVQDWITHLESRYGTADSGGVRYVALDNEPMLWNDTHRDVHPQAVSYDEMRDRTITYATAIKAMDSHIMTLGPVVWGWTAYFYSALDWEPGGAWWTNPLDRNAHGGTPFIPWYLSQMQLRHTQTGQRLLDYLDLHYYPQSDGVSLSSAGNLETQTRRLRSTRSLWDATYTDESWIGEPVNLIPRMRAWVDANYPGTKLAVTEYNWGGLEHINGAVAQADVLGIFGREGLDLACLWGAPDAGQPGDFAFRMYRNYNGSGAGFGDVSVLTATTDQHDLAAYAALRASDSALTIMVVCKAFSDVPADLAISGVTLAGTVDIYRYSAASLDAIVYEGSRSLLPDRPLTFPAQSITLLVFPTVGAQSVPSLTPGVAAVLILVMTMILWNQRRRRLRNSESASGR